MPRSYRTQHHREEVRRARRILHAKRQKALDYMLKKKVPAERAQRQLAKAYKQVQIYWADCFNSRESVDKLDRRLYAVHQSREWLRLRLELLDMSMQLDALLLIKQ